MQYVIAVLAPPIYFLMKKKWVSLLTTCLLLGLAVLFGVLKPIGLISWALCAIDALWELRKEEVRSGKHEVQPSAEGAKR